MLDEFLRLEIPEGFRAELLDKEIIVSPPPSGRHERAISAIITQVIRRSAVDMSVSGNRGLLLPGEQGTDVRHVIPDAVFAPEELDVFNTDSSWMEPDGVALVVEVTSQRPRDDRLLKHRAYARAEVPLYLLVDRDTETAHLYSEPNPNTETYTQTASAPFGSPLPFPAPFSFTLDTSRFD
ncbi:Uma2 family endonuclease [Actinocorallia sp. API 0066]|uniref:Uma2 family endonuclease n=1 Tax=Actinocorallia sp. API 0066 TaxID=2896846 RepID=UPI001E4539B3|nr:Uma2 family endonuclease [Actinocorallia sp. API 0066]MCD0451258.1 Uma2 family endonuclease [Actinocorallia sp. API 0066]